MTKKKTKTKNIKKSDLWHTLQTIFVLGIIVTLAMLALELTKPMEYYKTGTIVDPNLFVTKETTDIYETSYSGSDTIRIKSGLFKPETQINDKPLADKTIQAIKSRLALQCIMDKNGEPMAFVKIQGEGLKQCFVGDTVSDLFTVKSIEEKSIKVLIVDHEVTLSL